MSLFSKRENSGEKFKAPAWDPYGTWSSAGSGFLGMKKDKHVILPGVTSWESRRLTKIKDYVEEKTGEECTLPQHMIDDVYSMYVNKDIKRRPVDRTNAIKQKVMDKVYNSLTKVVTEDSPLFSQVLTRELAMYMQKIERELQEEMEKNGQGGGSGSPFDGEDEGEGNGQGQGDTGDDEGEEGEGQTPGGKGASKDHNKGNHGDLEDIADKILDKAQNEKNLEKAMNNADKIMKDLTDKLGEEALADLAENDADFLNSIEKIKHALDRVSINKESIKQVLVKILDESQNYFSQKFHTVEETLFEAEQFDDLFGLEFLHPIFRNAELLSPGNATRVYKGKLDLYLDCSGSMGSHETFEGTNIRMIDLVKGIAMVLYRMNMIDKLYFFDTQIYEIKNINEFTILGFDRSGGTNFNNVTLQCAQNGRNSVVITDGEDSVDEYKKNIFWVGVGGTQFTGWSGEGAFSTYKSMRQCVTYNSGANKFDYVTK
jgi:hypothetical protein